MAKQNKHQLLIFLGLSCVKLLACLPLFAIQILGYGVGFCISLFPSQLKQVTLINLEVCFPEQTPAWRKHIAKLSIINTVMTAFEYAIHWFWPIAKIKQVIVEPDEDTTTAFYAAQALGKGVIILSPHMGAWESMLGYLPEKMAATMMYRPLRIPALENIVRSARERAGAKLVPAKASGIRAMFKALKKNEVVVMLPDQVPSTSGGVIAPFFGQPALTMTLAAKFAQKTGAKVMVGFVERLPHGKGFKPHAVMVDDAIYNPDMTVAVTAMNQALEHAIRQHPDQYVWSYKRFKRRGAAGKKLY
jgi:Kdo2-lipid IVA lauroyltransferase/acyltransferase